MYMSENLRIQCITIDAHDLKKVASFWAAALDWKITFEDENEISLELLDESPEVGRIPDILFIKVPDDKVVKNRLHLDLRPQDQATEVSRLESLGAKKIEIGQSDYDGTTWVVMADPEGNEFCVLRERKS
jgi:predicted enzyme related to lactoylglutathione lyase